MKIPERLKPLVDEGLVHEVVRPLMSGKEAALYIVETRGGTAVAKVYKDAKHRSFRQKTSYLEGRRVRNSRQQRAMEKGSRFGKEQAEEAWQNAEVDALYRLSAAGVRVPKPHVFSDGVLLMDLVVDAEGEPAPRLWDVELTEVAATDLHGWLVRQVVLILCAGMVHGDLSEYNVLIAGDGPMIIDLPQATDAAQNPNAKRLFLRDVDGLTRFLTRFAPALAETRYGEEIWDLYERGRLVVDSPLTGKWKGATRKVDTRAVIEEIRTAEHDAARKRERDGEPSGKRGAPKAPPRDEARPARAKPEHAKAERADARPGKPEHAPARHERPPARAERPAPRPERAPSRPERQPSRPAPTEIDLDALDALLDEGP